MGDRAEGYPNGTYYVCEFDGAFQITDAGAYAIALSPDALNIANYASSDWIEDGIRYVVSGAYGIEGGSSFTLYSPDTPVSLSKSYQL